MGLRVPPMKPLAFVSAVVQCAHCGTWRNADISTCERCGSVERRSQREETTEQWRNGAEVAGGARHDGR